MRKTPATRSMKKLSQISFATDGVAVAVRQSTRSTSISSANRAIFRYSGLKLAPHCAVMSKRQSRMDKCRYLRYAVRLVHRKQ